MPCYILHKCVTHRCEFLQVNTIDNIWTICWILIIFALITYICWCHEISLTIIIVTIIVITIVAIIVITTIITISIIWCILPTRRTILHSPIFLPVFLSKFYQKNDYQRQPKLSQDNLIAINKSKIITKGNNIFFHWKLDFVNKINKCLWKFSS